MRVIVPVTFDRTTQLTSTTATNAYADWDYTTSYAPPERITYQDYYWEAVDAVGSGTEWAPDFEASNPWLNIGPANKHAMFDESPSSLTEGTGTLTVVVTPGDVDSLALINLTAYSLSVTGVVGTSTTYSASMNTDGLTEVVLTDLPGGTGLSLTVSMMASGTAGTVSVGDVVFGAIHEVGTSQAGASASMIDYSTKQTDTYGDTVFVQRGFAKTLSIETLIPNGDLNRVMRLISGLRATPTVWIASDHPDYSAPGIVFGYYRDFQIDIRYPTYSICSFEIDGLV